MSQRVAVVTGSNKGIGLAIVRALCRRLDNGVVYLTARDEGRGKEAVAGLHREGLQPRFHQLDVTDRDSVRKMRDFLKENHGGLDILVNNAAIAFKGNATEPFGVQATVTVATNFTALLEVNRMLVPLMHPHGRIVNMGSYAGHRAFQAMSGELQARFQAAKTEDDVKKLMQEFVELANAGDHSSRGWPSNTYATSKMGVIALTRVQAADMSGGIDAKDDVLMICCCPGHVATDMNSRSGQLTVDQGAETPTFCALLPPGSQEFQGKMFSEKKLFEFW